MLRIACGVTLASAMLAVAAVSLVFGEGNRLEGMALGGAGAALLWFSMTRRWTK